MPRRQKPWYRPRNLILFALGLLAAVIGREVYLALSAKPGQAINYMDKARELVAAYQPPEAKDEPNAWPILLDAIDRLSEAESIGSTDPSLITVPLDLSVLYTVPDRENYDDNHTWDQVRARAREALTSNRATGTFDRLADLAKSHRFERPLPASGQMIGVLLPELGKMRQLARLNAGRLAAARQDNNDVDFVAAYEETLTLGRACAHQAFLIDYLVGIAITTLATDQLRDHLTDRPFSEATLRALLEATDRQLPFPPIDLAFEGEKLSTFDTIQWTHTDNGRGSGRFIPSTLTTLGGLAGGGGPGGGFLGTLAQWKILNLAGVAFPSKAATMRRTNEFYDGLAEFARAPAEQRRALAFQPDSFVEGLPRNYMLLRLLLPAIAKTVQARDQGAMEAAATRVMLAVELFSATRGRYPASLDELVPSILPALPTDPINGKPFGYRLLKPEEETHPRPDGSPRPYLLYSFGVDGIDNHGAATDQSKFSALRTPANHDFILNVPHSRPKVAEAGQ